MKTKFKILAVSLIALILLTSCNRPEPNYEGVLMTDYGRNGLESFTTVTGAQGPLGPGSELYQVPMFEDKGLKAFNYGMSGGHLFEASLLLKLMIERKYVIKNVILETDLNLSNEERAEGIAAKFLPYIHNSEITKNHFLAEKDFKKLYYIPFYRYVAFESRIGFREMFFNGIHKKTNHLLNMGYSPLGNGRGNMKNDITNLKPLRNKYFEEIKQICEDNKINLIAVMTPMCSNTKGLNYFEKVKQLYPEIHNYEKAVEGDQFFSSCGHLNDTGARLFTSVIIKDFFNK